MRPRHYLEENPASEFEIGLNRVILEEMENCIRHIQSKYGIELSYENILEYVEYIEDFPQGRIENEIDSFMAEWEVEDIKEAITRLPGYNVSE